jgi:hypothetical protein
MNLWNVIIFLYFYIDNLTDEVPYKVVLKNLNEMNDIAERFVQKQRVVKEKTSQGGFRIPAEKLKKRVNPSEYIEEYDPTLNPTVNSFSFNPYKTHHTRLPKEKTSQVANLSEPLIDEDLLNNRTNNRDVGSNLIEIIEKQVDMLKRESEEQQKILELSRASKNKVQVAPVEENKVLTEYISYNPGRVQAIKHVTTNFKPEYMSLEDLQKLKEEHYNRMVHIENEFYEKKRQEKENIDRMNRFADDDNFIKQQELQMKHMESRKITPEELEQILQHENNLYNESRKSTKKLNSSSSNVTMKTRAKSANGIKRSLGTGNGNENKPLDNNEKKFVRKYLNYMMKKKLKTDLDEDEGDWNKTRIKSLNVNGEVNRTDGLPGHIDNDDYSFYYFSIADDTPRSLSLNSKSRSKSRSHSVKRQMTSKNYARNSYNQFKKSLDDQDITYTKHIKDQSKTMKLKKSKSTRNKYMAPKIKSHLAFIKLIFNLLDSKKQGKVAKDLIVNNLNLEEDILKELGFSGLSEFLQGIVDIPTLEKDFMTEDELKAFLLSRSEIGEDFAHSKKFKPYISNKLNHSNSFTNFENKNLNHDEDNVNKTEEVFKNIEDNYFREDEEEFPGMKNNRTDFLKYGSTKERLEKLEESLSRSSSKYKSRNNSFNKSLNKSLKNSLKEKISNKSKSKVNVDYKDYKNFMKKYKSKKEINFTIPKPFDFLKTDYDARKLRKMYEILEERKKKEDEIINHRFKANELKREIFISQFDNIIEAEKVNRKYRTERLKEKIVQNMKPFSFYEQDERRHKEKLERRCEAPQFPAFKANPVPWTSQVNLYEDILKKMEVMRKARIEERKIETAKAAKLPPRMEMHEQKKKKDSQEMKMMDTIKTVKRSQSFRAKPIPNFGKAHENFMTNLEKKKAIAKPTEPVPFNFHEPKVKNKFFIF